MTLVQLENFLSNLTTVAFVVLALASLVQWRRTRSAPAGWMTLTFLVLAGVLIISETVPDDPIDPVLQAFDNMQIPLVLMFPYFLFRFSASFEPASRRSEVLAAALTGLLILWAFFVPDTPDGSPEPASERLFSFALLIDWVTLSSISAFRLWRQGRGLPGVARRRMRLMSTAATILNIGLILAVGVSDETPAVDIAVDLLAQAAAVTFFFGYSPPEWIRASWRRSALEAMRGAVRDLLSAASEEEVIRGLIPHAKDIVGARAIAFLDPDNRILHQEDVTTEMLGEVAPDLEEGAPPHEETDHVVMKFPFGCMVVWTSPYAPFFGGEEFEILTYLGTLAHLALERTRAAALKIQLAEAQLRRRQALEINDNIVQGLAVAKYAFELGDEAKARSSLDQTLTAAKNIISELLSEIDPSDPLGPALLTRDQSASAALRDTPKD